MEEGLKKRLVGAAVLASLAVIFVPMLLDGAAEPEPIFEGIPQKPQQTEFASSLLREEIVKPQLPTPVAVEVELASEETPKTVENPVKPKKAIVVVKPPQAGLTAWVVQVGSFSSRDNAQKLVKRLRDNKFQTQDAERIEIRGKTLFRVRVGPMVSKEKAQSLISKVNKVAGVKARVVSYP